MPRVAGPWVRPCAPPGSFFARTVPPGPEIPPSRLPKASVEWPAEIFRVACLRIEKVGNPTGKRAAKPRGLPLRAANAKKKEGKEAVLVRLRDFFFYISSKAVRQI